MSGAQLVCQFGIPLCLTLLPIIGYVVEGINQSDQDIAFWNAWIMAQSTGTPNISSSSYSGSKSTVQNVAPYEKANIMQEYYDPELAAFLGTQ